MSPDTVKWSAALLKMCLGSVTVVVESPRVWEPPAVPALLVLAVLPTLAGDGRGERPPGKGDLDWLAYRKMEITSHKSLVLFRILYCTILYCTYLRRKKELLQFLH